MFPGTQWTFRKNFLNKWLIWQAQEYLIYYDFCILVLTCWPLIYIPSQSNTVTLPDPYSFLGLYIIHCIPFWCLFILNSFSDPPCLCCVSSQQTLMTHCASLSYRLQHCDVISTPLLGSLCESITQVFFLSLVLKPQQVSMCLLESLDSKYVLFN